MWVCGRDSNSDFVDDPSRSNAFDMNNFSGFVDVSSVVVLLIVEDTATANADPPALPEVVEAVAMADVDDSALKEVTAADDKGNVFAGVLNDVANRFDCLSATAVDKSSVLCRR